MKLSVIMPVYNEQNTVKDSINRLLKQKYISQLIVVDDGSIDNSVKLVKSIKNKKKLNLFKIKEITVKVIVLDKLFLISLEIMSSFRMRTWSMTQRILII